VSSGFHFVRCPASKPGVAVDETKVHQERLETYPCGGSTCSHLVVEETETK
jgi:hypothetical protein